MRSTVALAVLLSLTTTITARYGRPSLHARQDSDDAIPTKDDTVSAPQALNATALNSTSIVEEDDCEDDPYPSSVTNSTSLLTVNSTLTNVTTTYDGDDQLDDCDETQSTTASPSPSNPSATPISSSISSTSAITEGQANDADDVGGAAEVTDDDDDDDEYEDCGDTNQNETSVNSSQPTPSPSSRPAHAVLFSGESSDGESSAIPSPSHAAVVSAVSQRPASPDDADESCGGGTTIYGTVTVTVTTTAGSTASLSVNGVKHAATESATTTWSTSLAPTSSSASQLASGQVQEDSDGQVESDLPWCDDSEDAGTPSGTWESASVATPITSASTSAEADGAAALAADHVDDCDEVEHEEGDEPAPSDVTTSAVALPTGSPSFVGKNSTDNAVEDCEEEDTDEVSLEFSGAPVSATSFVVSSSSNNTASGPLSTSVAALSDSSSSADVTITASDAVISGRRRRRVWRG